MEWDSVQIGVTNLDQATSDYATLLGSEPIRLGEVRRFALGCGAVEIEAGEPGLHSMRFVLSADDATRWPTQAAAFHGLDIRLGPPSDARARAEVASAAVAAVDHVVVQSPDLDRAIALWRDQLGVRLALDREFPKRGLRMCFFRNAGVTLEFVGALTPPPDPRGPDEFYGIAYRVISIESCRDRLARAGVDVSAIRPGQKSGTRVVSVRSGTAGVPTLLIEDPSRA